MFDFFRRGDKDRPSENLNPATPTSSGTDLALSKSSLTAPQPPKISKELYDNLYGCYTSLSGILVKQWDRLSSQMPSVLSQAEEVAATEPGEQPIELNDQGLFTAAKESQCLAELAEALQALRTILYSNTLLEKGLGQPDSFAHAFKNLENYAASRSIGDIGEDIRNRVGKTSDFSLQGLFRRHRTEINAIYERAASR